MHVPARACAVALLALTLALQVANSGRANPIYADEGGGMRRATWDFAVPSDYYAAGVALAAGAATLAKSDGSRNYTNDAEFLAAESASNNATVRSGVRLLGNQTDLVRDGTFDQAPGPWSYVNGTTGAVTAERESAGRARLGHTGPVLKFDSMDSISGPNPWVSVVSNPGDATSNVSQETVNRMEGTGSLRDVVTILQNGNRWGGVMRNDPLLWDWTGFNRLAFRMDKATPGFLSALVFVQDQTGGQAWGFWTPVTGWARYAIDLSPFTPALNVSAVDLIWFGFQAPVGVPETVYLDDLVLYNATAFDESARVEQAFTKMAPTDGSPNSLGLTFQLQATASSNVVSSFEVSVDGTTVWTETPVAAGARPIHVDLSGNVALQGTGNFTLRFSLLLNRTGWEEASMTAWIDNVTLLAPGYRNGTFTSTAQDAGSAVTWTTLAAAATLPPATSLDADTRSGSTAVPGDPTWSPWQRASAGAIRSPPGRYLQWRLLLWTADESETPVVTGLTITFTAYVPTGEVRTHAFLPPEPLAAWRQFLANDSAPPDTTIAYDLSFDGGATWTPVTAGQNLSALPRVAVVARATFGTVNTTVSPRVAWIALRYETSGPGTPVITGVVPDQLAQEDAPPWSLDLAPYARIQPDPADTLGNLEWYLTGVNESLYTVFGMNTFGRHTLAFTPVKDAFGTDDTVLWLEDRGGAKTSQPLRVSIQPVNDPPVWAHVPEVWVKYDLPYALDLRPYVADVDTPAGALTLTTEDPSHIALSGLVATYLYPGPTRTIWVRHYVSDGQSTAVVALVTIHITDNPPPQTRRPIPDLVLTEDVPAYDVFRPDSLSEFFVDVQGEPFFLTSNFTNLDVGIWQRGSYVQVNVSAKPDFCGSDRITFRATDQRDAFAEYTDAVTVVCVNDPPVLAWRDDVHVRFDDVYTLDLTSYISDVDNSRDALVLSTNDSVHASVDRFTISFLYPSAQFGPNPVTVPLELNLSDPQRATRVPISVVVSDNRPPEIVRPFDDLQFPEDTVQRDVIDLPLHFVDDSSAVLTYEVSARNISVTIASAKVTLTPPANWFGPDVLAIRATDSEGAFALATVRVDVLPVDDAPFFNAIPVQVSDHGGQWVLDLRPFVHDVDNGVSELTFSTNSGQAKAVGYLLFFSYPDRAADDRVVVTVRDPANLTATVEMEVRVGPSIWTSLYWPWSGGAAAGLAAVAYAGWRRKRLHDYNIEDMMIIGHEGLLLAHTTRRLQSGRDSDIMAAMLTATLMFIRDSFREDKSELSRFEMSHDRAGIVTKGPHVYGAAICTGRVPDASYVGLKEFVDDIEERYGDRLAANVGMVEEVLPGLTWAMSVFARHGRYRAGSLERLIGEEHVGHTPRRKRWGHAPEPTAKSVGQVASDPSAEAGGGDPR